MSDFKPVTPGIPEDDDPNEEFPFLHTITVVDRVVSVDKAELVQNNIKTETVTLNLDSEWDGLSCIINIGSGETPTSLIWNGQPVVIPAELMTDTGTLNVSVVGYGEDGTVRAVTKKADNMFTVVASGYVEGDEPVPDPTTILGQLVTAGDKANEAADNANAAAGNANAAVDRANELAGKLGDIDAQVTDARGSAEAAANSAQQAAASASAAQTSERNAANSVMQASQSATAAKQSEDNAAASERNAASSAEQASNIVASVSGSVSQAEAAARSASQSSTAAAGSASAAGGSAQAAADSASKAGESATAAKASETNAAFSASSAKVSETNSAASATAAQQAVDGFGLEVGTTTTGEPGSDAAVEIEKTGTKYTASFTIPRGDKGEQGDVPSLSRTMASPESQEWNAIDFNDFTEDGVYTFNGIPTNGPRDDSNWITGTLIVSHSYQNIMQLCAYSPSVYDAGFSFRRGDYGNPSDIKWKTWHQIAFLDDLPSTSALANEMGDIASLSTRMQALEARVKSLETNQ